MWLLFPNKSKKGGDNVEGQVVAPSAGEDSSHGVTTRRAELCDRRSAAWMAESLN